MESAMKKTGKAALDKVRALYRGPLRKFFEDSGSKGGKKRTENLTPEERREIARKAARARWRKRGTA
jgi:hypothetical protein